MGSPAVPLNDTVVHILIFVGTAIFSTGVAWGTLARVRKDVDGIGRKVNTGERVAARRYHNISLAVMQVAPPSKESEISQLLKEECN
jgi:hypothetical protein